MNVYSSVRIVALVIALFMVGCVGPKGDQGVIGPSGTAGQNGIDGKDSIFVMYPGTLSGNFVVQDTNLTKFNFFNLYMYFNGVNYSYNISTVGVSWDSAIQSLTIEQISGYTIFTPTISNVPPGTYTITLFANSGKGASLDTIYFRHSKLMTVTIGSGMHGDFGNLEIPGDFQ
jgi:hypothetical protein